MTHKQNTYNLSDIFKYEALTRQYCINKGCVDLDTKTLINLGLLDDNYDYAKYIEFKHVVSLEELIDKKVKIYGLFFSKNVVNDPDYFLEYKGDYYEELYNHYKSQIIDNLDKTKTEQIIDMVIKDNNNMDILYYIYFKEEEKINEYLARREDEINTLKREVYHNPIIYISQIREIKIFF